MSWEYSALLYTPLILIREGAGRGGAQGRPEMGQGAGLASGRLTFSPGVDTLIDRLCHGSVIHSCLSYTHRTHTHTHLRPSQANTRHMHISTPEHKTGTLHNRCSDVFTLPACIFFPALNLDHFPDVPIKYCNFISLSLSKLLLLERFQFWNLAHPSLFQLVLGFQNQSASF